MVKPDGLQRGLVHEIIKRFEKKGLKLIGMKLIKVGLVAHNNTIIIIDYRKSFIIMYRHKDRQSQSIMNI